MFVAKHISRYGNSLTLGFSAEGLHLMAASQFGDLSEIVMHKAILPLDWKRVEIAKAAADVLDAKWRQSDFLVIALEGYQTEDEKALFCLQGCFRLTENPDWIDFFIDITVYEAYKGNYDSRKYHVQMRKEEVEQIRNIVHGYWN